MIFKIGLLIIFFLIICEIDEVRYSIDKLNVNITKRYNQEESKDDNKNTTAMQKQEKQ